MDCSRILVYEDLQFACIALFCLAVPLLLAYRAVRSDVPWWFVIASATAVGWILSNADVFFQHRVDDESVWQSRSCSSDAIQENRTPVITENGMHETFVENPCGTNDRMVAQYGPVLGLLYGPLYLVCCSLPYWLIVGRRSSRGLTRKIALLAGAALAIEWAAIVGECSRPGYLGGMCRNADPYIWPPFTVAAAFIVSWVVTTQLLPRFGRRA